MEHEQMFGYEENFHSYINNVKANTSRMALLNPWMDNELANPYLNVRDRKSTNNNITSLHKIDHRNKTKSLNQSRSTQNILQLHPNESNKRLK